MGWFYAGSYIYIVYLFKIAFEMRGELFKLKSLSKPKWSAFPGIICPLRNENDAFDWTETRTVDFAYSVLYTRLDLYDWFLGSKGVVSLTGSLWFSNEFTGFKSYGFYKSLS